MDKPAVAATGGAIKINFSQILINLVVVVVMILIITKFLKFQLVDATGNVTGSLKPSFTK